MAIEEKGLAIVPTVCDSEEGQRNANSITQSGRDLEGLDDSHSEASSIKPADSGKDAWLFLAGSFMLEALLWGTFRGRIISEHCFFACISRRIADILYQGSRFRSVSLSFCASKTFVTNDQFRGLPGLLHRS